MQKLFLFLFFIFLSPLFLDAENWPNWRGARRDGTSVETNIPSKWTKTENVAWRVALPGPAGSTPIVWDKQIFLTSAEGDNLVLISINTDGKFLWKNVLGTGNSSVRGDEANLAAPSPTTDGKYVWAFAGSGDLACFDFAGNEIWKTNLQQRYGTFDLYFVMSSTPLLDGNRLYIQLLHTGAQLVLALDKTNGKEIWKHERPSDAREESRHSYASPYLYRDGKREFLLIHGSDYITAHKLTDGKEIWRAGGLNSKDSYNPNFRFVTSPVATAGLIVVPSAKNGPVHAINADSKPIWTLPKGTPDVPSPVIHDGILYLCRENGDLIAVDAKNGNQIYQERTHQHRHRASPIYADGKIFLIARDGVATVVKAGRTFQILSTNEIGEPISSSPVVSNGTLYLRSFQALYAIRNPS
jgi:outer membrane protein assembly factor BamB